jgi:hypothetical protein
MRKFKIMKNKTKQLIMAGFATLIIAGCATASSWEYRTFASDHREGQAFLDNHFGNSGWELVSMNCVAKGTNFEYQYIFKRPKK